MKILSKENFIVLLLFISFLYAFIPVEGGAGHFVFLLHSSFLILITLLAIFISKFKLKMNRWGKISLFLLFFYMLLSMIVTSGGRELSMFISIVFSFITASAIHYNIRFRNYFFIALKWLISISIVILILQLLVFMVTGEIIHVHEIIFPFSEARVGTDKLYSDLYRFGGLYIEPGTYSNWMYLFLIIYMLLSKKIFSPLVLIGALSITLSYSVWGMVFGAYLFIIVTLSKIKKTSWKSKVLLVMFFLLFSSFVVTKYADSEAVKFALFKLDTDSTNASTQGKINFYKRYEEHISDLLLIGEGYKPKIYEGIVSPQDTGIVVNLSVIFGMFFTFIVLLMFTISLLKCCGWFMLFASFPIFVSKIYFSDPVFWLLYFLVIYCGYSSMRTRNSL